ncbi:MAG TPA: 4-hydroxy-tetrahydrodipicolinate reductase [Chitinophagaceae bacterium]|jgi:4-hydroxy-tetrahydrodipicolinate reductase|nr:4-hydroxy-tetrahydrodipicolinate reductase [Chitinophagaceae bacterium]
MRIALIGYGKMGQMIDELAAAKGHEVVLKINIDNTEEFTAENISQAEVAIEFTGPSSAYGNVRRCIDFGIPVVTGSTGWNEQLVDIKKYVIARNGSFLHASNFSIGVNIFFEVNKLLARLMASQADYEVQLREIHHTAKVDAPSGTAVSLAEHVLTNLPRKKKWVNHAASAEDEVSIISERIDPAPGIHHVRYSSEIDDIEIIHTAHNRKGFASGAIVAAEYIHNKKGVFTMQEVLGL